MILSLHDYWMSLQLRVSIDNQQTPTHGPAMVPTAHFFVFCLAYIWSPCFATMPGPPLRWKDHKFNLGVLVNPHFLELRINNNFFFNNKLLLDVSLPHASPDGNQREARHPGTLRRSGVCPARLAGALFSCHGARDPFCTSFVTDLTTQNLTNTFEWPIKTRKLGFEEWQSLPAYPIWIGEIYPYSIYFVIYTSCISEKRYYIKGIYSLSELRNINLVDIAKVGLAVMVFPFNWWFFMLKFVPIFIL